MRSERAAALAALLAALPPRPASAQEVVAVLSSDLRPYREAYQALQDSLGRRVPVLPLGEEVRPPPSAKVVVAFGGKAALARYPPRVALVYAVAPGIDVSPSDRGGVSVKVPMEPEPSVLLGALRRLKPGLKRLGVPWSSDGVAPTIESLKKAGRELSIQVDAPRLEDPAELPARLRELRTTADALWIPPDPALINARDFATIRQFCRDNGIPFFAPTQGLVEQGADASVSVGYAEIGRAAAGAARTHLDGGSLPVDVYAARPEIGVSASAAKRLGWKTPDEILRAADKVFP